MPTHVATLCEGRRFVGVGLSLNCAEAAGRRLRGELTQDYLALVGSEA
ncbi:hypothetical protein ACWEQC_34595 [Streptomyces shenzhenensis]